MSVEAPVPKDHPLMVAWAARKATQDHANNARWAVVPEFTTGALWGEFVAGWEAATPAEVAALRDALAKEEERGRGWCNDALEAQEQVAALKREVERLREAIHNLRGIPDGARLCEVSLDAYCEAQRAAGPLAHKEPGDEG
jgi:hypothetical protein